jgi:hypothetical protein
MKLEKIGYALAIVMAVITPIILWFIEDFVERSLGFAPPLPGNQPMRAFCHIWAVQMAVSLLCGVIWPIKLPGAPPFARAFIFALLGGLIGTLYLKQFPHLWVWWMPLGLAVFGLVQVSLIGLTIGTSLRQGCSQLPLTN